MVSLRMTGYDNEGYIHLPSGPLPVLIFWNDDGTPDICIDVESSPPDRLREFEDLFFQCTEEEP